jgi:hypothetical protein
VGPEIPDRRVRVRDDVVHARVRPERIPDHRDADAGIEEALCKEGEVLLGPHLPEAAVDENEHGRLRSGREVVDAVARARSIRQIEMLWMPRTHLLTPRQPLLEHRPALGHRLRIVVGEVERRSIHRLPGLFLRRRRGRGAGADQGDADAGGCEAKSVCHVPSVRSAMLRCRTGEVNAPALVSALKHATTYWNHFVNA